MNKFRTPLKRPLRPLVWETLGYTIILLSITGSTKKLLQSASAIYTVEWSWMKLWLGYKNMIKGWFVNYSRPICAITLNKGLVGIPVGPFLTIAWDSAVSGYLSSSVTLSKKGTLLALINSFFSKMLTHAADFQKNNNTPIEFSVHRISPPHSAVQTGLQSQCWWTAAIFTCSVVCMINPRF